MEHKLGEIFEDGGVNLMVEKAYIGCAGCYFLKINDTDRHCMVKDNMEKCRPSSRKDHTNVIFVKVNNNKDMGTRNIKIDLKTAKEWFEGSDETLKKLALQAYKEEELRDSLPNSWEEFCENNKYAKGDFYIKEDSYIERINIPLKRDVHGEKNLLPSKESAEAHLALMQLERLRDCYRDGWKPDWENIELHKYVIYNFKNKIIFNTDIDGTSHFLAFPSIELCEKFYSNFKDLIETAKDLI